MSILFFRVGFLLFKEGVNKKLYLLFIQPLSGLLAFLKISFATGFYPG